MDGHDWRGVRGVRSVSAVCVQCGCVYTVCPQYISAMPNPCRLCGGGGQVWKGDDYYTCLRCEGDGWDTPLEGCCDCGEEHEEDEPEGG
jgi:hypothetical protein